MNRKGFAAGHGRLVLLGLALSTTMAFGCAPPPVPPPPPPAPAPPPPPPPPPPSDRDGDGIVDTADACPDKAGVANDDAGKNGCPLPPPEKVKLPAPVKFATGSDVLAPESDAVLSVVVEFLK